MQHITVLSNTEHTPTKIDYTPVIVDVADGVLNSLIDGFSTKEFGYDTTYKTAQDIRRVVKKHTKPAGKPIFIDSSGYSIINGDVAPWDTVKVIDCYHEYQVHEFTVYDYIFSLDIPINTKFPLFNTYQNIEDLNRKSLSKSRSMLEQHPLLREKFYFIYQFKCQEHYEIWDRLYNELELGNVVKNWAFGGMVGLKKMAKISFSPFIGMAFRCFYDYLNSTNPKSVFKLHFLGIYHRDNRFMIAFLEKLFNYYLAGHLSPGFHYAESVFTYDTINYIRQAQMKKNLEVFDLYEDELIEYTLAETPDGLIDKIYTDDIYKDGFYSELENRKADKDLINTNAFAPLSIYSNIKIDNLFEYIIEAEGMIEIFTSAVTIHQIETEFKRLFKQLKKKYPKIFTNAFVKQTIMNLMIAFEFHRWYKEKGDRESLQNLVKAFIKLIGLKDVIKSN